MRTDNSVTAVEVTKMPDVVQLSQNHPNPFNPVTTIPFTLSHRFHVTPRVYLLSGRLVRTIVDREVAVGSQRATSNGTNDHGNPVASGV